MCLQDHCEDLLHGEDIPEHSGSVPLHRLWLQHNHTPALTHTTTHQPAWAGSDTDTPKTTHTPHPSSDEKCKTAPLAPSQVALHLTVTEGNPLLDQSVDRNSVLLLILLPTRLTHVQMGCCCLICTLILTVETLMCYLYSVRGAVGPLDSPQEHLVLKLSDGIHTTTGGVMELGVERGRG